MTADETWLQSEGRELREQIQTTLLASGIRRNPMIDLVVGVTFVDAMLILIMTVIGGPAAWIYGVMAVATTAIGAAEYARRMRAYRVKVYQGTARALIDRMSIALHNGPVEMILAGAIIHDVAQTRIETPLGPVPDLEAISQLVEMPGYHAAYMRGYVALMLHAVAERNRPLWRSLSWTGDVARIGSTQVGRHERQVLRMMPTNAMNGTALGLICMSMVRSDHVVQSLTMSMTGMVCSGTAFLLATVNAYGHLYGKRIMRTPGALKNRLGAAGIIGLQIFFTATVIGATWMLTQIW